MKRKLKRLLEIILLIIVTCVCIALGFKTRYENGILLTKFDLQNTSSNGTMLETSENKIIIIDGGSLEDAEHITKTLINKGGIVEAWFITNANENNVEVLEQVIKDGKIQINNIYVSLNSSQWYLEHEQNDKKDFLNILDREDVRDKVHEVALREEITIDNLNFKILKIKMPDYVGEEANNNQSMVIKVSNNFKDVIFFGNLSYEVKREVLNNNLDEIDNNSIQISEENEEWIEEYKVEKNAEFGNEDVTVRIW